MSNSDVNGHVSIWPWSNTIQSSKKEHCSAWTWSELGVTQWKQSHIYLHEAAGRLALNIQMGPPENLTGRPDWT